jgi:hypothetical protein
VGGQKVDVAEKKKMSVNAISLPFPFFLTFNQVTSSRLIWFSARALPPGLLTQYFEKDFLGSRPDRTTLSPSALLLE